MHSPIALGPTTTADGVEGDGDILRATITTPGATSVDVRYVAFDRVSGAPLLVSDPVAVPSALSRRAYRVIGSSVTVLAFTTDTATVGPSGPPGLIAQRWTVDAAGRVSDTTLYSSALSLRILAADGSSGSSAFVAIGAIEESDGTGQLVMVSLADVMTTTVLMSIPRVTDMTADAACDATGSCTLAVLASGTTQAELAVAAIDDTAAPPAVDVSVIERVPPPPLLPTALRIERYGALAAISLGVTQATPDDPRSAIGGRVIIWWVDGTAVIARWEPALVGASVAVPVGTAQSASTQGIAILAGESELSSTLLFGLASAPGSVAGGLAPIVSGVADVSALTAGHAATIWSSRDGVFAVAIRRSTALEVLTLCD